MTTAARSRQLSSAAYLADGIDVLPDRVVDAVLDEAHRTRRRRHASARGGPGPCRGGSQR